MLKRSMSYVNVSFIIKKHGSINYNSNEKIEIVTNIFKVTTNVIFRSLNFGQKVIAVLNKGQSKAPEFRCKLVKAK